jgi:surface protein
MHQMFHSCTNITSIDLSNIGTNKSTNMAGFFEGCNNLSELKLPDKFITSYCTNLHDLFDYCHKLTSVNITNWDTSNVTDFSFMFEQCYSLVTLDLSSLNFDKAVNYNNMFSQCNSLTTVYAKDASAKTFIDARLSESGLTITSIIKT